MGKATKWFRGLLGLKKSEPNHGPPQKPAPPKKKWSFGKLSHKDKDRQKSKHVGSPDGDNDEDASKHAIAVAAATAAVAEAAVAAAQAAAAVVELTSTGGSNTSTTGRSGGLNSAAYVGKSGAHYVNRDEWAAVTIQSHFRAYLSRRALKALRALVKLQALARGYIWRKRWGHGLRQMQALIRAQERARAGRALIYEASHLSTKGPATPEKFERIIHGRSMKHEHLIKLKKNGSKSNGSINFDQEKSTSSHPRMSGRSWDERTEKILEVDTGRPHPRRNISRSSHLRHSSDKYYGTTAFSSSSGEVQSMSPLKVTQKNVIIDENAFWTAENSPQFYSASSVGGSSSQRGAFTPPTKSLSGYSDHPNYMAYTQSSKAKVRSLSAPKQRQPQYERSSSINRYSVHGYGDLKSNAQKKCYPGSGRLDRFGLPVRDTASFSGGHWIGY